MKFGSRTSVPNLPNDRQPTAAVVTAENRERENEAQRRTKKLKQKKKELAEYARTEKSLKRPNFIA